jgi:hypothetical protein
MKNIIEALSGFIGKVITVTLLGGSIALLAGEIRLAALKKASKGTTNTSSFTSKLTKTKLPF